MILASSKLVSNSQMMAGFLTVMSSLKIMSESSLYYEGKMVYRFDHRFGDYRDRQEGRVDSVLHALPIEAQGPR